MVFSLCTFWPSLSGHWEGWRLDLLGPGPCFLLLSLLSFPSHTGWTQASQNGCCSPSTSPFLSPLLLSPTLLDLAPPLLPSSAKDTLSTPLLLNPLRPSSDPSFSRGPSLLPLRPQVGGQFPPSLSYTVGICWGRGDLPPLTHWLFLMAGILLYILVLSGQHRAAGSLEC